jgi:hypothetical protein
MFYEQGCHGRVQVGSLPGEVAARLAALPGEWLEFDASLGAIVVRHIQPTAAPTLPTIAAELVRILVEIPVALHRQIAGGDFHVHTEDSPHLVRIRVDPGGAVRIDWAHPDYAAARKRLYDDDAIPIEGVYCRLNGTVTLRATDARGAARQLQRVADTYEGLYPEGDFQARPAAKPAGTVDVELRDVNLDPRLLVARLVALADEGSLRGTIEVRSFDDRRPDDRVRLVFQDGSVWVQEPYFFPDAAASH